MRQEYCMVRVTTDTHRLLYELQKSFQASYLKGRCKPFWDNLRSSEPAFNDLIRELARRVKEHRERSRGRTGSGESSDASPRRIGPEPSADMDGPPEPPKEFLDLMTRAAIDEDQAVDLSELKRQNMTPGEAADADKAGRDRGNDHGRD